MDSLQPNLGRPLMAMPYEGSRAVILREKAAHVCQIRAAISASDYRNGLADVLGWVAEDVANADEPSRLTSLGLYWKIQSWQRRRKRCYIT
jgi:hypothetical protein